MSRKPRSGSFRVQRCCTFAPSVERRPGDGDGRITEVFNHQTRIAVEHRDESCCLVQLELYDAITGMWLDFTRTESGWEMVDERKRRFSFRHLNVERRWRQKGLPKRLRSQGEDTGRKNTYTQYRVRAG